MGKQNLTMQVNAMNQIDVDVLIAGGGVTGSTAAAALSSLGLKILIIEPKAHNGRRLAGELIHPPGIDGLRQLGLLENGSVIGSEIKGFAIFPFDPEQAHVESLTLPYSEVEGLDHGGMAIEHQTLKDHLLEKVKALSDVEVWMGARVSSIEEVDADRTYAAIVTNGDQDTRVNARLIIGADGAMSQVRKLTGIPHETHRYSGMLGLEVDDRNLPNPGYGNIFQNPVGISYAYSVTKGRARVMFEVLRGDDTKDSIHEHLKFFPAAFRADIEKVLNEEKPLAAANYRIVPQTSVKANIALLGDARGCCHPLTASGITTGVKDALTLRDLLIEHSFNVPVALRHYSVLCGRVQLTRRTLSEELREAFLSHTAEAKLLNECIFAYWRTNPKGRAHSLALLSTQDSSILSMGAQFIFVVMQAFKMIPNQIRQKTLMSWIFAMTKLAQKSLIIPQTAVAHWFKEQSLFAK
jgi:2-polyprenyl-6-methoxyphenol hydroxylase-like FAD-dependent oxidoreductase